MIQRKKTRAVKVRNLYIGGGHPITIQSMTNTKTANVEATLAQVKALEEAGCDIVRITVNNDAAADGFAEIRKHTNMPLVADIHFDYKMALRAIEAGADKIRINPGNIGGEERAREVINACKEKGVAVRIGVNGGSLQKELIEKYGHPTPEALAESAMMYVELMEKLDFDQFVISIKATDVPTTIAACEKLAELTDYPQHIGITESGTIKSGTIKSAAGLGAILSRGIGDTMRVSLSGDVTEEVAVAKGILQAFNLKGGVKLIACPTCGRTEIDLAGLAEKVEKEVAKMNYNIHVAVMGCVVNGPGEAKEADIGIAGGKGEGLLFVRGEIVKKVPEKDMLEELMKLVHQIGKEKQEQEAK